MLTYCWIRLAWLALWLALLCFPSAISLTFSNDLSQLKIPRNCSQETENAILETPYIWKSPGPP